MLVWRGLEHGKSITEIVADLTSSYDVAPEEAIVSVQRIVDQFQSHKLTSAN